MMIYLSKKTIKTLINVVSILSFISQDAFGQKNLTSVNDPTSLQNLHGYTQTYFYSEGSKERAKYIANLMERAGSFFEKELGFRPKTTLYILAPQDWKDYAAQAYENVYGFPHNADSIKLVIASDDNDFWRSFLPSVDQLPTELENRIRTAYGNSDGSISMMPFFDLLALHEMAHSYTSQAHINMQRHWMNELFSNIMLHTYIAEQQPELLSALEVFPEMVVAAGNSNYKYTSLEDFETLYPTLGMGPKNYGWYQCKLHTAAKTLYDTVGKSLMKNLWNVLKNHTVVVTDIELIDILEHEVHPNLAAIYTEWNKKD